MFTDEIALVGVDFCSFGSTSYDSGQRAYEIIRSLPTGLVVFIRPFEKRDVLCYGVWRPSVNFFVSG